MARIASVILLGLLAVAFGQGEVAIGNLTPCVATVSFTYTPPILCSSDLDKVVQPASTWKNSVGACTVKQASGSVNCNGKVIQCTSTKDAKFIYDVKVDSVLSPTSCSINGVY